MGKKFCLTLDKNVLDFCKLNDIEDVRGFAIKCFDKGLTIEKYGETPLLMPKEIQTVINTQYFLLLEWSSLLGLYWPLQHLP